MTLSEALIGLQAYKEVDQRMALFWHAVDEAIVGPRTALHGEILPGISADDVRARCSHLIPTLILYSLLLVSRGWPTAASLLYSRI